MNATPENERHQLIRSIFQKLDADEPVEAMNIRDAFHAVWDRLFYLGEYLESAASQFEGSERSFLVGRTTKNENRDGHCWRELFAGDHAGRDECWPIVRPHSTGFRGL